MKKIDSVRIFGAFSLAEALITLLIVCLVTIAAVPVLTKKKRTLDNGHGSWICTLNKDGKYVTWQKGINEGDPGNPDGGGWTVLNGESCKFTPPVNVRNFGVTLIGGGGGGSKSVKGEPIYYLDSSKTETVIEEEGLFNLAVIGGGGGGAGGALQSTIGGGGGGAGSMFLGKVRLRPDKYSSSIGGGGAKTDSQWKEHSTWGSNGGSSAFYKNGKEMITAYGGTGGQSRNCSNIKCWGGDAGVGGSEPSVHDNSIIKQTLSKSAGVAGTRDSGNGSINSGGRGGVIPAGLYRSYETSIGGSGGNGRIKDKGGASAGYNGNVMLWRKPINGGGGGNAASPVTYPIPRFIGEVKVIVGKGGETEKDGEITKVQIMNIDGRINTEYSSNIGTKGSAPSNGKATKGQDSLWKNKGGGEIGKCTEAKAGHYTDSDPINGWKDKVVNGKPVCVSTLGISTSTNPFCRRTTEPKQGTYPDREYSNNEQKPYYDSKTGTMITPPKTIISDGAMVPFGSYIQCPYSPNKAPLGFCIYDNSTDEADSITNADVSLPLSTWLSLFSASRVYWSFNTEYKTICLETEKEPYTYTVPIWNEGTVGKCEDSLPGTYFGAGGGGAPNSDDSEEITKGGKGAPGAVIIEW